VAIGTIPVCCRSTGRLGRGNGFWREKGVNGYCRGQRHFFTFRGENIKLPKDELVSFQVEGGSNLKMPNIKSFINLEGLLSQGKINEQLRELKRLGDLKALEEKSEEELKKLFNKATLKAQAQKWNEHEAKKAKMIEDFKHQISFRADPLPITKMS
nr:hypothetical protein [Tanacetum cinerariifolium]